MLQTHIYILPAYNDFLSNLIKTWTSQIGTCKKQNIFPKTFFPAHFPFSAHEKAVFAIWVPSVVYGTKYNAEEKLAWFYFF